MYVERRGVARGCGANEGVGAGGGAGTGTTQLVSIVVSSEIAMSRFITVLY
jgi:hypothetical protein